MQNNLRRFKKVWKTAHARLQSRINELEVNLSKFSEEATTPERNITNPVDSTLSDAEKIAALGRLTKENFPVIQKLTRRIDRKLGTESKVSIKTDKSILNKAHRPSILAEHPWFAVEHVRDSLRFMTAIKDVGQIGDIMGLLVRAHIKLVKIDVRKLVVPKKWGWRFIAADIRMPNGQICEYYITFEKLARVMWDTHRIYERWRQAKLEDGRARRDNPQYLNDLRRSKTCYAMAFLSSLNEGKYGASTFLERWIETLERMLVVFQTGVLPQDVHAKVAPSSQSQEGLSAEEDEDDEEQRMGTFWSPVKGGWSWVILGISFLGAVGVLLLILVAFRKRRASKGSLVFSDKLDKIL